MSESLDLQFCVIAEKFADRTAIICDDMELSYQELAQRVNRLANFMREQLQVHPGDHIGIFMKRSADLVVAILAVARSGAAYVPFDPSYPQDRIEFMQRDSQIKVLLTETALQAQFGSSGHAQVLVLDQHAEQILGCDAQWQTLQSRPEALAYIMYTSGSTGNPKGVAVTQQGIVRLVCDTNYIALNEFDRVAQVSNSSFDAATFEIWGALLNGSTLVIIQGNDAFDPTNLARRLKQDRITTIVLTSAVVSQIAAIDASAFAGVNTLLFGGEKIEPKFVRLLLDGSPPRNLKYMYGPTETTTFASGFLVRRIEEGIASIPIGYPIAHTQLYILDEQMQQLPLGEIGEIYIGGAGVARGYLNRSAMTAEKFVPDPFGIKPGNRLYRTGDLARFLADGEIEFMGRNDHLVKIRGYRIELGEIEAAISRQPTVKEALVSAWDDGDGDHRLVAYVVLNEPRLVSADALKKALQAVLPPYMVPNSYVFLDAFPLTPNHKIDRAALPVPGAMILEADKQFYAPLSETEIVVAKIWEKLLKIEQIGIDHDFFELGGHSLLAIRLVAHVQRSCGIEMPINVMFEGPTIKQIAAFIDIEKNKMNGKASERIVKAKRQVTVPMSLAQERLWFLEQLNPNTAFYNIPMVLRLHGPLHSEALEWSLNQLIQRHEILRTEFGNAGDDPVQIIKPEIQLTMPLLDLSHLTTTNIEVELNRLIDADAMRPFDLAKAPLLRVQLVRLRAEHHVCMVNLHHIIFDEWSINNFVHELAEFYAAFQEKRRPALQPLPIQFGDFAQWQRNWLRGDELARQLTYWKTKLADAPAVLNLPTDFARSKQPRHHGACHSLALPSSLLAQIHDVSTKMRLTPFMTLLAAWNVLLYRYTGVTDLCIGTPVANRSREEVEGLIGFFVNTLVLRTLLNGAQSFAEVLQQVRNTTLEAYTHQDLSFGLLVEHLNPERCPGVNPLVQVMFSYQGAEKAPLRVAGVEFSPSFAPSEVAKFDLSLVFIEHANHAELSLQYATEIFTQQRMTGLLAAFADLLGVVLTDINVRLANIPLTFGVLTTQSNARPAFVPRSLCIHELFEEQVRQTPQAIALQCEEVRKTFVELNHSANHLAVHLREAGVKTRDRVAIYMGSSLEAVVCQLAILKAGAAFVPIDIRLPAARVGSILQDTAPRIVLTKDLTLSLPVGFQGKQLALDTEILFAVPAGGGNLQTRVSADDIAYCIYTSGSTGMPKGVLVPHRAALNLADSFSGSFDRPAGWQGARVASLASIAFDASIRQLLMMALGATHCIFPEEVRTDMTRVADMMQFYKLDTMNFTPSTYKAFLEERAQQAGNSWSPAVIFIGGEKIDKSLWQSMAANPATRFFNMYGPTEATVHCAFGNVDDGCKLPNIGSAIANTQIYLLDADMNQLPAGATGEIYIGGVGVALGYLNRAALTAERFVPDPFGGVVGTRLYRTGDLGRYLPSGELEYLGRNDHQVKIRGYRIELGEIEAALLGLPGVGKAVVLAGDDTSGEPRLTAYLVAQDGCHLQFDDIRLALQGLLPHYMLPASYQLLQTLPLTVVGKIDRLALAKLLSAPAVHIDSSLAAPPANDTEQAVEQIWRDVLSIDSIDPEANYFDLGGHSLNAVRVIRRVRDRLGLKAQVATLYENPTIRRFSAALLADQEDGERFAPVVLRQGTAAQILTLVHPIGGDVSCYRALAEKLPVKWTVLGFQRPEFKEFEQAEIWSLEELAKRYVLELRKRQPYGPYRLAGWSLGGVLAFAMARRLEDQGQIVDFLGLIDSHFLLPGRERSMIFNFADLKGCDLGRLDFDGGEVFRDVWRNFELHVAENSEIATNDEQIMHFLRGIYMSNWLALSKYEAAGTVQQISFYPASASESIVPLQSRLEFLSKYSRAPLQVQPVQGDHFSIVVGADMPPLAELLSQALAGNKYEMEAARAAYCSHFPQTTQYPQDRISLIGNPL